MTNTLADKVKEQDELLARLTQGALVYGTVVDKDTAHLVVSGSNGSLVAAQFVKGIDIGDQVLINPETFQIVGKSARALTGAEATVERHLEGLRYEISADGHMLVALKAASITGELKPGDGVLLDSTKSVVLGRIPAGKSSYEVESPKVRWAHIGGQEEAKVELQDALLFIKGDSKIFANYNAKPPKGVLLFGPPGCGKTLLAKAVATELSADGTGAFMYVKGPEILNMYVGESERRIRAIFKQAKSYRAATGRPSVVFIDEADAILQVRGSGRSSDMEKTIVPSFLTEMDGLEGSAALVILATNRDDTLDPAVLREGRIDRKIAVKRPPRSHGREIFKINLAGLPLHGGVTHVDLANVGAEALYVESFLPRMSGALIAAVVDRAKRTAIRRDVSAGRTQGLRGDDILEAIKTLEQESPNAAA